MILIIATTWLIVSALTLLFIAGAHAAGNPSYDAQRMVEPGMSGSSATPAQQSLPRREPRVELPINRAS